MAGFEYHSYSHPLDPIGSQPLARDANLNFEIKNSMGVQVVILCSHYPKRENSSQSRAHPTKMGFSSLLIKQTDGQNNYTPLPEESE